MYTMSTSEVATSHNRGGHVASSGHGSTGAGGGFTFVYPISTEDDGSVNVVSPLSTSQNSISTNTTIVTFTKVITDDSFLKSSDTWINAEVTPGTQELMMGMADYQASLAVWRYCPIVLLLLGTMGNLMTVCVLSLVPDKASSTAPLYFRALAVSDLCLLYSGLLRNWIKYFFQLEIRDTHSAVCKLHIWVVYATGMISAWLLVAVTSQRALCVVWPHRIGVMCNRRTASVTIAVIVVSSCLLNAHNLYGYDLRYSEDNDSYYCDYLNKEYEYFARGYWPWVDLVLTSLLPFSLLIGSNSLLMWKVASSIRSVKKLTSATNGAVGDAVTQRKKMSTSLNLTLICLSAMFLLLTSPICLYLVIDHYYDFDLNNMTDPVLSARVALAWAVTNNLWYANSALNFYLYCLSGSKFRQQVWSCVCCLPRCRGSSTGRSVRTVAAAVGENQQRRFPSVLERSEF